MAIMSGSNKEIGGNERIKYACNNASAVSHQTYQFDQRYRFWRLRKLPKELGIVPVNL